MTTTDPDTALQGVAVHWSALVFDPADRPRVAFDGHEVRCVESLQIAYQAPEFPDVRADGPRLPLRTPREYATVTMKVPVASHRYDTRSGAILDLFTGPDPQRVLDTLEDCLAHLEAYAPPNEPVLQAKASARRLLEQAGRR